MFETSSKDTTHAPMMKKKKQLNNASYSKTPKTQICIHGLALQSE